MAIERLSMEPFGCLMGHVAGYANCVRYGYQLKYILTYNQPMLSYPRLAQFYTIVSVELE